MLLLILPHNLIYVLLIPSNEPIGANDYNTFTFKTHRGSSTGIYKTYIEFMAWVSNNMYTDMYVHIYQHFEIIR